MISRLRIWPTMGALVIAWCYTLPPGNHSELFRTRDECEWHLKWALRTMEEGGMPVKPEPQCVATSVPGAALPSLQATPNIPMKIVGWNLVFPSANPSGAVHMQGPYEAKATCEQARRDAIQRYYYNPPIPPDLLPVCLGNWAR